MKFAETYKSSSMVFGIQRSGLLMGGIILRATVHLNSDAILYCLKSVIFLNNSANSCPNREIVGCVDSQGSGQVDLAKKFFSFFRFFQPKLSHFRL